jgi:uncharacterized membrane protein
MSKTRYIAQAGVIAAVYGVLSWITVAYLGPLGWGNIQFRVSEAVTVLAVFTPAAIPGLAIGCAIANLLNPTMPLPLAVVDAVFGSLGSLLGALWTWHFRKRVVLALLGPVIANAIIVAAYLPLLLNAIDEHSFTLSALSLTRMSLPVWGGFATTIAIGQAVVVYCLGLPLLFALRKTAVPELLDT